MRRLAAIAVWAGMTAGAQAPAVRFHHLHLNSTDPAAAAEFYARHFDCERAAYAGAPAVWTQRSWLLFEKAAAPPPPEPVSGIWHFGWGAEDMPAEYRRQVALGSQFDTPLTDISDLAGSPGFYYAYIKGPDGALVEINTAPHHRFGHLHLFSEDPVAAGDWYERHLGLARRGRRSHEPRFYKGVQVGPSASLMADNVNILIFPAQYARQAYAEFWKGRKRPAPTVGRVVDHVAFSVDDLEAAARGLRASGVAAPEGTPLFIDGPDGVRIELVQGHARKHARKE